MNAPRILSAERRPEDAEPSLRPSTLKEFVGQQVLRDNLGVFVKAARARNIRDGARTSSFLTDARGVRVLKG